MDHEEEEGGVHAHLLKLQLLGLLHHPGGMLLQQEKQQEETAQENSSSTAAQKLMLSWKQMLSTVWIMVKVMEYKLTFCSCSCYEKNIR